MTITENTQVAAPWEPDQQTRRTFFRRMTTLGAAVVGAIAATWLDAPSAYAAPGCCSLYYPNGPWCGGTKGVDGVHWSCPHGTKHYWSCHTTNFYYTCWECNTGSNCWSGTFYCSNYYVVYVP
jgi:hypothetical protein